jgi:SNF2 family DNA or RNA helicase
VERFQNGLHKVFLAHPQAAGHGLTLTKGTRTIWVSPTWNLETFIQANRRIYRAGQHKRTETIVLTAEGTVEEQVFQRLTEKDAIQTSVLDLMEMLSV